MALFSRRPRLDDAAQAALGLAPKERVLAFAPVAEATLVATDHRLALLDGGRLAADRPWHEVDSAAWDRDASLLRIHWVDGSPSWALAVADPDVDLMTTLRARVQSSLVSAQSARVDGRTVRVVLRRDLAHDELFLQHQYGQGLRADDPRVTAAAARLEAVLRDDAGLPPTWSGRLDDAGAGDPG